jgi:hypothetical protein
MALVDHDDVVQASRRRVPTNVSTIAFAFGALYGVQMPATVEIPAVNVVSVMD